MSPYKVGNLGIASQNGPTLVGQREWSFTLCLFLMYFVYGEYLPLGMWKAPVESPSAFSYCELQNGRDQYPSPKFSSVTKASSHGYSENSSLAPVSSKSVFCSNNQVDPRTDSFPTVVNKESSEKRQGTTNGYRLFGIELLDNSAAEQTTPVITASGAVAEQRPVPSLDAESDGHSEPSNINRSDFLSVSCEPEKSSCLILPQESQSRQIRSCTKVLWPTFSINHKRK